VHLSDAQRWRVVTESGEHLGRVFDLRAKALPARARHAEAVRIDTVVYGVAGLLERLGIRRGAQCEVAWEEVVAVRDGRLVVRDGAPVVRR
jgi:hypothetical protein